MRISTPYYLILKWARENRNNPDHAREKRVEYGVIPDQESFVTAIDNIEYGENLIDISISLKCAFEDDSATDAVICGQSGGLTRATVRDKESGERISIFEDRGSDTVVDLYNGREATADDKKFFSQIITQVELGLGLFAGDEFLAMTATLDGDGGLIDSPREGRFSALYRSAVDKQPLLPHSKYAHHTRLMDEIHNSELNNGIASGPERESETATRVEMGKAYLRRILDPDHYDGGFLPNEFLVPQHYCDEHAACYYSFPSNNSVDEVALLGGTILYGDMEWDDDYLNDVLIPHERLHLLFDLLPESERETMGSAYELVMQTVDDCGELTSHMMDPNPRSTLDHFYIRGIFESLKRSSETGPLEAAIEYYRELDDSGAVETLADARTIHDELIASLPQFDPNNTTSMPLLPQAKSDPHFNDYVFEDDFIRGTLKEE